ncbi:MAG: hypothetical protein IKJ77_06300 [Firmicutes bacterium]|nr:hypothetical protein [Bacillota bacterium]
MNDKQQNIQELERRLAAAEIPRIISQIFDGYKIAYINDKGEEIGDVVEHQFSYGLEAMGFDLTTDVEGWLSVDEAFNLFVRAHEAETRLAEMEGK